MKKYFEPTTRTWDVMAISCICSFSAGGPTPPIYDPIDIPAPPGITEPD